MKSPNQNNSRAKYGLDSEYNRHDEILEPINMVTVTQHLDRRVSSRSLVSWVDSPKLSYGIGKTYVVADDVEQAAQSSNGDQVDQAEGNFGDDRAEYARADVINSYRLQTPADVERCIVMHSILL